MAAKHALHGARPAEGEAAPTLGRAATAEIDTNALSGPITVPQTVALGHSGIRVHPLVLAAGRLAIDADPEMASGVLDRFAALGGTLIDAADVPGDADAGRTERLVGEWLDARGTHDRMRVMVRAGRAEARTGRDSTIAAAVDASLRRLRAERVDLLCLDGDDPADPLEERLGAVDALITAGKVRAIGAAGFSPERLLEARVLAANGLPRFEVLVTRDDLAEPSGSESASELVAHAQGLAVLPDLAVGEGIAGVVGRARADARHDRRDRKRARELGRRSIRVHHVLERVAAAHDTTPTAVAVAWLLARPTVVAPIAAARRPEAVDALMAASSLILHRSELVELDRASS
ncbi:aldo/keto reductase [Agromyces arachidis]|uniref:aldo/keto reductase n=1 Tax=Agromyces arachidis TaxID=766966 RepID=UPI0040572066